MSRHTTFGVGGAAKLFLMPQTEEEFIEALNAYPDAVIIGNGSNLIAPDEGINKTVISTTALREISVDGEIITAQAGALLPAIASAAMKASLTGFEFASGIPGTVGGAAVMNAGAYGGEMSHSVRTVRYYDGEIKEETSHGFSYRRSVYYDKPERVILSVTLKLSHGEINAIREKTENFSRRRSEKQPLTQKSAGSAFKRPEGYFAGELIERCGLKGYTIGGAQVSKKHAGFIVNIGTATCKDILALIKHVQQTVLEKTGVSLETEYKML